MNLKKLIPWNWFKHENSIQDENSVIPVKREDYTFRTDGRNPMLQLHQEVDRLFDDVFSRFGFPGWNRGLGDANHLGLRNLSPLDGQLTAFQPQINVCQNEKGYTITLEAAGLSEKDITIEQTDRQLIIKGHKQQEVENKESHFYRIERQYGEFQRILDLPEDARTGEVKATMEKGLLTINLPRHEQPNSETRRIEISNS